MKKTIARFIALTLSLMLLLASGAQAAVVKWGDAGDEVRNVQLMLFECGFLFELPDGKFGNNTEQAVKNYQEFAGLPVDGVADEATVDSLTTFWLEFVYGVTEPDPGDSVGPSQSCILWDDEAGNDHVEYCERHSPVRLQARALMLEGTVEGAQAAVDLWRGEVVALYEDWLSRVGEERKGAIVAARAAFLTSVEVQRAALAAWQEEPGASYDVDDPTLPLFRLEYMLRLHAAQLCMMLNMLAG